MKYYKFINEAKIEEYGKGYIFIDDVQISNPSADLLLKIGVKSLVVEDKPMFDENTQYIEHYYVDGETEITQKWRVIDAEVMIDDEIAGA